MDDKERHRIPVLDRENWENWFRQMKLQLQSKEVFYTTEQSKEQYAWIVNCKGKEESDGKATPDTENGDAGIQKLTSDFERLGGTWNKEKAQQFDKDQAKALYCIVTCLSLDDQEIIDEYETAEKVWTRLKSKYSKTSESTANTYMTRLQNFEFDKEKGIDACWSKLREYRRKLIAADSNLKQTYPDQALLLILTRSLPTEYKATRDGLRLQQQLTVDEKIKILVEVDEETREAESKALIARQSRQDSRRKRRSSSGSSNSDKSPKRKLECYICGEEHLARDCAWRGRLHELIQSKERPTKRTGRKSRQSRSKGSPSRPQRGKNSTRRYKPDKSKPKKRHAYAAESEPQSGSDSDDESSDTEEEEVVATSREIIGKILPSDWIADSGASSHMTDQLQLFRKPLEIIKRRAVKVGGGRLYTYRKGTVEMRMKNGRSALLSDVLFVPKLGVNLLSGRKICASGLKGHFDSNKMKFKDGEKTIITAQVSGGVYVVNNIAKGFDESAFQAVSRTRYPDYPFLAQDESEQQIYTTASEVYEEQSSDKVKERYKLWHRRFAHLGPSKIGQLHEGSTLKKPVKVPSKMDMCEVCKLAKMRRRINHKLSKWKDQPLDLVSLDVAGPFPISLRGNKYFVQIVDNATRKNWSIPLKTKDEIIPQLRKWKIQSELETGQRLRAARTDNAPEIKSILDEWCTKEGIHADYTVVYTSHQNGVAERSIQTSENSMRAMLKDAALPLEFWDEAVEADAYIRNRTATGPEINKKRTSPEEAYFGEKPSIDHIRVWGSKCYSYVDPKSLPGYGRHDKLMDRGRIAVFVGYCEHTTQQLRVYSPDLGYTIRSNVVDVDESIKGGSIDLKIRNQGIGSQGTPNDLPDRRPRGRPKLIPAQLPQPTVQTTQPVIEKRKPGRPRKVVEAERIASSDDEYQPPHELPDQNSAIEITPPKLAAVNPELVQLQEAVVLTKQKRGRPRRATIIQTALELEPQFEKTTQDVEAGDLMEEDLPRSPYFTRKRKREEDERWQEADDRIHKIAKAMLAWLEQCDEEEAAEEEQALLSSIIEIPIPQTYKEAIEDKEYSKEWHEAIDTELKSLRENGTWEEQIPPPGANLVSTKWVFTVKYTSTGEIERFKARLVARGFSQVYGLDYNETFAPTVRMDTLRIFLAIVAAEDLHCDHIDIKNAFTESHLKEEIYLSPPTGVKVKKGYTLRVRRSLYGLKQSARDWNLLCRKYMKEWGFIQSLADPCLYNHQERGIIVLLYVDDIPVAAADPQDIAWFKAKISSRFRAKDLGEIEKILGMRITRNRKKRTLWIDQEQYLNGVLTKFGIEHGKHKPRAVPISGYDLLRPANSKDERIDIPQYQQIIGSLLYATTHTRPDISFALGKLSQYMSDPAKHHGHALKGLLRYIRSTISQKMQFGPGSEEGLVIYSDADWASDKTDRKSTSGNVAMLYNGPVSWGSRKQRSVATSSTESEYMAMSMCAKQGQWIAQVLRDMGYPEYIGDTPTTVDTRGDNQGALALIKNPHLHERSKHIDICYHFIRDLEEKRRIAVRYIPTEDMIADGLTKPLQATAFQKFKNQLGLTSSGSHNKPRQGGSRNHI